MSAFRRTIFDRKSLVFLSDQFADTSGDGDQTGDKLDQVDEAGELLVGDSVVEPVSN